MPPRIERVLTDWLASGARGMGQIAIRQNDPGFALSHRDDAAREDLETYRAPNEATELAKTDRYKSILKFKDIQGQRVNL